MMMMASLRKLFPSPFLFFCWITHRIKLFQGNKKIEEAFQHKKETFTYHNLASSPDFLQSDWTDWLTEAKGEMY